MANEVAPSEDKVSPEGEEDLTQGETEETGPREHRRRGVSEKRIRIVAVVAVVAVVVIVLLWGMVPQKIYEVRDVVNDIDDVAGKNINIKGIVIDWETNESNFTLADSNDENITIRIQHSGPFPEGFGINATAVIKGLVKRDGELVHMDSDDIQIGCPSKY
jgi:cytochrome c-type biogenesis protein CcmE